MVSEIFMRRCFQLAGLGAGNVSPNPMVGAVLVYDGRIIAEGWHQRWGEAHAEVNCLRAVSAENQEIVSKSTLYCNLEPCAHFGKTPPCVDLILEKNIPHVVVANTDPNPLVAGKGLAKLRDAGLRVESGVLEDEGLWLNRAFFKRISKQQPYLILKWAQSADGFIARHGERTAISSPATQRLVHRWRAECDAILVGAHTARIDNPRLDVRQYFGKNPIRIALDRQGKIPSTHHLLDDSTTSWIIGPARPSPTGADWEKTTFVAPPLPGELPLPTNLPHALNSVLVEGGAEVLGQFLAQNAWDEIRLIENPRRLGAGLAAPLVPPRAVLKEQFRIGDDTVRIFVPSF